MTDVISGSVNGDGEGKMIEFDVACFCHGFQKSSIG